MDAMSEDADGIDQQNDTIGQYTVINCFLAVLNAIIALVLSHKFSLFYKRSLHVIKFISYSFDT